MSKLTKNFQIQQPSFSEGLSRIFDISGNIKDNPRKFSYGKNRYIKLVKIKTGSSNAKVDEFLIKTLSTLTNNEREAFSADFNKIANDLIIAIQKITTKYNLPFNSSNNE